MKYRADIDGLRAIAVIPVVLFHAGVPGFGGGYVGVDVFFVISGYLITSLIASETHKADGQFSITWFYERRIRRIFPALFVLVLFCVCAGWYVLAPNDYKSLGSSIFATSAFVSNILFWSRSGYFEIAAEQQPLLHAASSAMSLAKKMDGFPLDLAGEESANQLAVQRRFVVMAAWQVLNGAGAA